MLAFGFFGLFFLVARRSVVDEAAWWENWVFPTGFAFLVVFGTFRWCETVIRKRGLPFPPGDYFFSTAVVDARRGVIRVYDPAQATNLLVTNQHTDGRYTNSVIKVSFPGHTFSFTVASVAEVHAMRERWEAEQNALANATARGEWKTAAELDPFLPVHFNQTWENLAHSPPEPERGAACVVRRTTLRPEFPTRRLALVSACLAMVYLGNDIYRRDQEDFRDARESERPDLLRKYLANGWFHRAEVANEHLPSAVLKESRRRGSVSALRGYLQEFPGHRSTEEARSEIHRLYGEALEKLRQRAAPETAQFFAALFRWLEEHDSSALLAKFAPPRPEMLRIADAVVAAQGGKVDKLQIAPIAPSFSAERCRAREGRIVEELNEGFRRVVPEEILQCRYAENDVRPTSGSQPLLSVHYAIAPSGNFYRAADGTRGFVGINIVFQLALEAPGQPTQRYSVEVAPPDQFSVEFTRRRYGTEGPADTLVYDVMAAKAFEQLEARLRAVLLEADPEKSEPETPASY